MFELTVTGNLNPIIEYLDRWVDGIDLLPLAHSLETILVNDNFEARMAGQSKDGTQLAPLRGGRALKDWEIRQRGGHGPPLAPRGMDSRSASDFMTSSIPVGDGSILISGTWPGTPFIGTHTVPVGSRPARNIVGIRPQAQELIAEAVHKFAEGLIGGSEAGSAPASSPTPSHGGGASSAPKGGSSASHAGAKAPLHSTAMPKTGIGGGMSSRQATKESKPIPAATPLHAQAGSGSAWHEDPTSVGSRFDLGKDEGHHEAFHVVFDAIHSVHGVQDYPKASGRADKLSDIMKNSRSGILGPKPINDSIGISAERLSGRAGLFERTNEGEIRVGVTISYGDAAMSGVVERRAITLTHEIGHSIDATMLRTDNNMGSSRGYSSTTGLNAKEDTSSLEVRPIMRAILASKEAKHIGRLVEDTEKKYPEEWTDFDKRQRAYHQNDEYFARAYAQYIAVRSRHPVLLSGIEKIRSLDQFDLEKTGNPHTQWSDESFEPIAKAFDSMFTARGMKR